MIGKPSRPVRREAARKRTSTCWHLAARPTHPPGCCGSSGSGCATTAPNGPLFILACTVVNVRRLIKTEFGDQV